MKPDISNYQIDIEKLFLYLHERVKFHTIKAKQLDEDRRYIKANRHLMYSGAYKDIMKKIQQGEFDDE